MNATAELNLSQTNRLEKLKQWMREQCPPLTFVQLAAPLMISSAILARNCGKETMPVYQYKHMRAQGAPADLLPRPFDQKPGPKPKARSLQQTA